VSMSSVCYHAQTNTSVFFPIVLDIIGQRSELQDTTCKNCKVVLVDQLDSKEANKPACRPSWLWSVQYTRLVDQSAIHPPFQ